MTTITLSAGDGGLFPNLSSSMQIETENAYQPLPDGKIIQYFGHFLTGWKNGGTTKYPGDLVNSGTWTAQWISDPWDYATGIDVAVRIWRTWEVYADVTGMLVADGGLPIVKRAENRPGSCSFILDMDWQTAGKNPITSGFAQWTTASARTPGSKPNGAIGEGMFVTVEARPGRRTIWQGRISTIQADGERLKIECGDLIACLGKQGATLRRNFYDTTGTGESDAGWNGSVLTGSISGMPSGAVLDLQSLTWGVLREVDRDDVARFRGNLALAPWGEEDEAGVHDLLLKWRIPVSEAVTLRSVYVGIQADDTGSYMRITVHQNGQELAHGSESLVQDINPRWYDIPIVADLEVGEAEIRLWTAKNKTYHVPMGDDMIGSQSFFALSGLAPEWDSQIPAWGWTAYRYEPAEGTVSGSSVIINSIGGATDTTSADYRTPPEDRFRYSYYVNRVSSAEIAGDIARSLNMIAMIMTDVIPAADTQVGVYRIGGGYAQDYLSRLADVPTDTGRRRSYAVMGMTVPVLVMGARRLRTDVPEYKYCWRAGDLAGASEFADFQPSLTLKGRPSLAVVRGSRELPDGRTVPLMAVVEDIELTDYRGISIETVQTSGTMSVQSAYATAFAGVTDSGEWEGTLTVPGILTSAIELRGSYAGAGSVVAVSDPRYGFSDWRALVTQTVEDWNSETTALTLTNYSPIYSSAIPDTVAAVQSAGDIAVSGSDLYTTQFCRAVGMWSLRTARTNTLEVSADGGTWWPCEDVAVIKTDARAILTGIIRGTPDHNTAGTKYGIRWVRANGTAMPLETYLRPDLYIGQTLIVVADCSRV